MSLRVYTNIKEIDKDNIRLIRMNDFYFDYNTQLENSDLVKMILKEIDKAEYNSPLTFTGRTTSLGALNKNMLSTGTKTLLNIVMHTDKCFDVCECGNNALCMLPKINNGNILWDAPSAVYQGNPECDIVFEGVRYTDFYEFLDKVGDSYGTI